MAVHPLRPATDRCLGGPLPHQLANQTRVHLIPPEFFTPYHVVLCAYAVLAVISNRYPPVWGRLPTRYSPVRHSVSWNPSENFNQNTSFDLHVLGTPPAFILSQDQTLMFKCLIYSSFCLANPRFTLLGIRFWSKHVLILKIFFKMWFTSFIRIFRVVLLFNYQASLKHFCLSVVRLSCATTIYILARFLDVVNTFFKFFYFSVSSRLPTVFAEKISFRKSKLSSVSPTNSRCTTQYESTYCVTEKEGFEPSRRY